MEEEKSVSMDANVLSKLAWGVYHSPPRSKHSHFVCMPSYMDGRMFSVWQRSNLPLNRAVPRMEKSRTSIEMIIIRLAYWGTDVKIDSMAIFMKGNRLTRRRGLSTLNILKTLMAR